MIDSFNANRLGAWDRSSARICAGERSDASAVRREWHERGAVHSPGNRSRSSGTRRSLTMISVAAASAMINSRPLLK